GLLRLPRQAVGRPRRHRVAFPANGRLVAGIVLQPGRPPAGDREPQSDRAAPGRHAAGTVAITLATNPCAKVYSPETFAEGVDSAREPAPASATVKPPERARHSMMVPGPSDAAINDLVGGGQLRSGKLVVGPLGPDAVRLLRAVWESRDDLAKSKGAEQVAVLRREYQKDAPAASPGAAAAAGGAGAARSRWRIHRLCCQSVRGIAPVGVPFEFPFEGSPLLIYGPNGSGKTSLLNAVIWIFTGRVSTDAEEDEAEEIPLYA